MTSMLLTRRSAPPAARRAARSSCARATIGLSHAPLRLRLAAVARRDVLLLGVGERRFLVDRVEHVVVRLDPIRGELPMRPVPLLDAHHPVAPLGFATDLHRPD